MTEFHCTREDLTVLLRGVNWEAMRCGNEAKMHNRDSKFFGEMVQQQRNAEWIAQNLELLLEDPNVLSFKIAAQLRRRESKHDYLANPSGNQPSFARCLQSGHELPRRSKKLRREPYSLRYSGTLYGES